MNKEHFLQTLRSSVYFLGPAFIIPFIILIFVEFRTIDKEVKHNLVRMAENIPILLAEDFHDRALEPDSISLKEEMENRSRFNRYAHLNGVTWVYTLVEYEGELYFTAPTVTDDEAQKRERWYFYPYEDAPEQFFTALETGELKYSTYRDQWGFYRTIILPLLSPSGNVYAACIDLQINRYFLRVVNFLFLESSLFILIFLLVLSYISYTSYYTIPENLKKRPVLLSRKELQRIVDVQTRHLRQMTEKAQAINLQLQNALYSGKMGLYAFNLKSGDLVEVFNDMIPELLGYGENEYSRNLIAMIHEMGDPERYENLKQIIARFRRREIVQEILDVKMYDSKGEERWFRLNLILQKGDDPDRDILLILGQPIDEEKLKEQTLSRQANMDALTGFYNRHYCENFLEAQKRYTRKDDLPLILCFIDINGLKTVNDNLGHNVGDQLLSDFAGIIQNCIRKYDIPVRFGGDEFILILPHTHEKDFKELWRRIERENSRFNAIMDRDYILSFSYGYSLVESVDSETDFSAIILKADERMYHRKREMKQKGMNIIRL